MPWEAASQFVYTQDNHNSVLGIRNLACAANASSMAVTMQATQGMGLLAIWPHVMRSMKMKASCAGMIVRSLHRCSPVPV